MNMGADRLMVGRQKQRSPFAGAYAWFPKGVRPATLQSVNAGSSPVRRSNARSQPERSDRLDSVVG